MYFDGIFKKPTTTTAVQPKITSSVTQTLLHTFTSSDDPTTGGADNYTLGDLEGSDIYKNSTKYSGGSKRWGEGYQ